MKKYIQVLGVLITTIICNSYLSIAQEKAQVKFEDIDIHESCFILSILVNTPQFERAKGKPYLDDELVIDSDIAYSNFQKVSSGVRNQACKSVDFPPIDFSQKTLLGKWASGSCAATGFERKVLKDDIKKEIIYSVKAIERNMACSGPGLESMNLITILKVPKDFKVVFVPPSDNSGYQTYSCVNGKMIAKDWNGNIVEPRNIPPAGGGVFGVQMDCGGDAIQKMPVEAKKLMIMSGADNIAPPCPDGTHLKGQYCAKGIN